MATSIKTNLTSFLLLFIITSFAQQKDLIGAISESTGLIINDDITRLLIHNSSGDRAHNYVQQISTWDRQQSTKDFNTAAVWIANKAKKFGLADVIIEKYAADGKTQYFGESIEPIWIANKGELWATSPYKFKITSYADLPMSLANNSYSTKVTSELVDIGNGIEADYKDKDLKGKIVLTSKSPYGVVSKAVWEKGALGIISYYSIPYWDKPNRLEGDYLDQVGWSGMPMSEEKEKQSFAFMISERKAKELKETLNKGTKIELFVDIETEHKLGDFNVIDGVIKGSKYPDEEIIVTAHIDHYKPGANDNASGSSVCLEMIRTLNHLIETKQIPRPLRTIRFLWLPEFTGTKAWVSRHINEKKKRILNLNMDMLGADLHKSNSTFAVSYTPDWNASYINAITASIIDFLNQYNNSRYPKRKDFQIISVNGTRNEVQGKLEPYTRGSDHQIFNDFGIPGVAFGTWPDNFYHSSEDTPDKVDPTQLHRVVFSGLASIMMTAYTDNQHAFDLISLVEMYGAKRLQEDEFNARKVILNATKSTINDHLYYAKKIMQYAFEREKNALKSCLELTDGTEANRSINQKIKAYNTKEETLKKELDNLAKAKATKINATLRKITSSKFNETQRIIPQRVKGKELVAFWDTYDILGDKYRDDYIEVRDKINEVLAVLREREVGELRIYDFENTVASYANGKKSLLDIRDAIYAEYKIAIPIETIKKLFDIFEKSKVMTFKK